MKEISGVKPTWEFASTGTRFPEGQGSIIGAKTGAITYNLTTRWLTGLGGFICLKEHRSTKLYKSFVPGTNPYRKSSVHYEFASINRKYRICYKLSQLHQKVSLLLPNGIGAAFHAFPFRRGWTPKYVPFDLTVVRRTQTFPSLKCEPANDNAYWSEYFKLEHVAFRG